MHMKYLKLVKPVKEVFHHKIKSNDAHAHAQEIKDKHANVQCFVKLWLDIQYS